MSYRLSQRYLEVLAGFYEDMVDYKPDRPLSGPEAQAISDIIPGVRTVPYADLPFMDILHEKQGTTPSTSTDAFLAARKAFFATLPTTSVPISSVIATQDNVNVKRAQEIAASPEQGGGALFFVNWQGNNYLLNGHHRMVGHYLRGTSSLEGKVFRP